MERIDVAQILKVAWRYEARALVQGRTSVGAAALSAGGTIFGGCNVQHRYRSQDVHAEVNALTTMVAEGSRQLRAIAVVSRSPGLTPCGACLDWIIQLGGDGCLVCWQADSGGHVRILSAGEMMPHHPPYV